MGQKRLRVFAGPNGSGKSSLTEIIRSQFDLGIYVNADEIEKQFKANNRLLFEPFGINVEAGEFFAGMRTSTLFPEGVVSALEKCVRLEANQLLLLENYQQEKMAYLPSYTATIIWEKLLLCAQKFTVETVMSHPSKLDFMRRAQAMGFKVYLYFVTLASPEMNSMRIAERVANGGHAVSVDKIESRYYRTMDLLLDALRIVDSAYLFDNSYTDAKLVAKKENGRFSVEGDFPPAWLSQYVLNKLV